MLNIIIAALAALPMQYANTTEVLQPKAAVAIEEQAETCHASAIATQDITDCTYEELAAWEQEIDKALERIQQDLPADQKQEFLAAHKAWEQYRDAQTTFYSSYSVSQPGTINRVWNAAALTGIVKDRALDLMMFPDDPKGEWDY